MKTFRLRSARHESSAQPDDDAQVVQIDMGELSAVFAAPRWLRDLGLASWLLVGVAALLVGLVLLIGAFVGLFPFRLLVHKGRTELAYGLACGIGLAGSAALAFGIGPLVKVDLGGFKAEIGLFILALLVAITAKRKPLPPSEFVPVGVPAR